MKWFFEFIYPLLHKDLKILCVGKITDVIPDMLNVHKIEFAENLQEVCQKSTVTINPLKDVTGMKVKVIESLAHGIPVVSTCIGLSGIKPEVKKSFMMANTPEEFAALLHRLISDKTLDLEYGRVLNKVFHDNFATDFVAYTLDRVFGII